MVILRAVEASGHPPGEFDQTVDGFGVTIVRAASGEVAEERFLEPVERASQSGDLRDRAGRERVQHLDREPPSHSMGLVVHRP